MFDNTIKYIKYLEINHCLDKSSIIELLLMESFDILFDSADKIRKTYVGDEVHLRGLIEFSNYCNNTCYYCGLRGLNKSISRYRMKPEEIIECAKKGIFSGLKTIVLQSGEDKYFDIITLCKIVDTIKNLGVAVTLSIGELTTSEYKELKKAGADRYLLRIETTNENLYNKLHPGMSYKNRIRCIMDLKELGYEVGTGSLVGLPGQTIEMLADDLLFFKNINADMLGIGPFIPCENTPLEREKQGSPVLVLKMIALSRLLLPDINIPATTALAVSENNGYLKGLLCGANVVMPNIGHDEYKKLYKIYPGKVPENPLECVNDLENIKNMILNIGRKISNKKGYRKSV
ncbi:MAG: [FeFe] hydrogenase H-cluster radical SAM maturase HydE [Thermoanaerobacteraceae bacterium]